MMLFTCVDRHLVKGLGSRKANRWSLIISFVTYEEKGQEVIQRIPKQAIYRVPKLILFIYCRLKKGGRGRGT